MKFYGAFNTTKETGGTKFQKVIFKNYTMSTGKSNIFVLPYIFSSL